VRVIHCVVAAPWPSLVTRRRGGRGEAAGVRVAKGVRREGIIDDIRVSIRGVPRVAQAPTSPLDRSSGSGFVRDPFEASRVLCS
jgi:hypothetical protein